MPSTSALVIGGGMAGMCAGRVLSDFVDRVTIIERDAYSPGLDFRPGVPQARHVHNLLARGLRELESFFPGFEHRMRERGAVPVESGWDIATLWPHGWSRRGHTGLWQLYASRPLIEATVLELCRGVRNVTFLERTEVTALRAAGETERYCTGVDVLSRDDGTMRTLEADLVVDASGAQSKSAEWLRQLGLSLPEDDVIDGHSVQLPMVRTRTPRVAARVVVEGAVPPDRHGRAAVLHRLLPHREPTLAAELYWREQGLSSDARG
jgi:2-polyprenyl-6-methoxyphenol hydroxylase-like FAD-dependent oxidoreductase